MSKISKVVYGNDTLIDLTGDTVNANNLLSGATAHGADGEPVVGAVSVTNNYNDLNNKPVINGVTLQGTLTLTQLGICYTGTQAQYAQDASNIPVGCIVNITDDYNTPSISVIDNLTSTSTTDALSANMGKYLNDNKANSSDVPQTIDSMNDVDITSPANGQALLYDYANEVWVNGNINILPTVVNDRYLHTNATTGALEWSEVQGGGSSATILTGTLTAGQTTITFTDASITATALIDIYTSDPDVGWISRSVSDTTLTVTYPVQSTDLSVKIRIEETGV